MCNIPDYLTSFATSIASLWASLWGINVSHRHLNPCILLLALQPQERTSISIRVISNETFIETHSKCDMSCTPIHFVGVAVRAPSTKVYQPQPFIPSKFNRFNSSRSKGLSVVACNKFCINTTRISSSGDTSYNLVFNLSPVMVRYFTDFSVDFIIQLKKTSCANTQK